MTFVFVAYINEEESMCKGVEVWGSGPARRMGGAVAGVGTGGLAEVGLWRVLNAVRGHLEFVL